MSVMEVEQSVTEQVVDGEPAALDALDQQLLDQLVGQAKERGGCLYGFRQVGRGAVKRRIGEDGGVTTWFRTYYEDEDLWLYFEAGADGWAMRQVELRASDLGVVTAASLEEVLYLRDHADLAAMQRYEQQFGVLSEGSLEGWQDQPRAEQVEHGEFERVWSQARAALAGSV